MQKIIKLVTLNVTVKIGDVAQLVEHYDMLLRGLGFNSSHLQSNSFYFGLTEDN
jgi:hypothetical protein